MKQVRILTFVNKGELVDLATEIAINISDVCVWPVIDLTGSIGRRLARARRDHCDAIVVDLESLDNKTVHYVPAGYSPGDGWREPIQNFYDRWMKTRQQVAEKKGKCETLPKLRALDNQGGC